MIKNCGTISNPHYLLVRHSHFNKNSTFKKKHHLIVAWSNLILKFIFMTNGAF